MPSITIDCGYLDQPQIAAAYLLCDGPHAAFIDNNTALAVPRLLEALHAEGLSPERVEHVIVTHVHLDHAGGTSALVAACPRATVLCHPRAARHLVDPSRLVASAKQVYGEETFARLYGTIDPIPAERVRAVADEERVTVGEHVLRFLHTRGHAEHHMCVFDETDGTIYTGDSLGLAYPFLQRAGLFVFPSTSPTDFDPDAARASLDRILATGAARACLTHFGEVTALDETRAQMVAHLDAAQAALDEAAAAPVDRVTDAELQALVAARIEPAFEAALGRRGLELNAEERAFLRLDLDLNAAGIAYVAAKRRKARAAG